MQTPEEVALGHAIIGFQHVKQGVAQTLPEDVALCVVCGWMRLSEYTLHIADLIRARDAEVAEQVRAETRYVVFDADWCEPPGDVIAVFATEAEAWAHIRGPGDGYGWSIVEVAAPLAEP